MSRNGSLNLEKTVSQDTPSSTSRNASHNWRAYVGLAFGHVKDEDSQISASPIRYSWLFLFAVGLAVAAVQVCRAPFAIFQPFFTCEDGAVFFRQAYQDPGWHNLFVFWCGYPRFMPRLLAEFSYQFPLRQIPLVDALSALVVTSVSLSFFAFPIFRHLVKSDWLRAAVCVMFTIGPNFERIMCIDPIAWVLLLAMSLATLMKFDSRGWAWLVYSLFSLAIIFSTPLTSPLIFLYALRLWVAQSWKEKAWIGICMVGIIVNVMVCDHNSTSVVGQFWVLLGGLFNGFCFRVINCDILGIVSSRLLLSENTWTPTYFIAGLIISSLFYLATRSVVSKRLPLSFSVSSFLAP